MFIMKTMYIDYCGGYVPLFVRRIFFQSSQDVSERLAQMI
jgi:hypothetical protein